MDSNENFIYQEIQVNESDSIQNRYEEKLVFSEQIIKLEQKTSQQMNKHELKYQIHRAQSMICGPRNECQVCKQQFGLMNMSHICGFCQNPVCSKHSKKKRIRQFDQKFSRICDTCEQDIIFKQIYQEAQEQREQIEKEINQIEIQSQSLIEIIKQNELNHQQITDSKNQEITKLQQEILGSQNKIDHIKEGIQQLKFKIQQKDDSSLQTISEVDILQQKIQTKVFLLDMKTQQYSEIGMKILNYEESLIQLESAIIDKSNKQQQLNKIPQTNRDFNQIKSYQTSLQVQSSTQGNTIQETNGQLNSNMVRNRYYCNGCLQL